jgi:hypothetical protein
MDDEAEVTRPDRRAGTRLLAAHTPVEVYRAIRTLAAENDRTIGEELHAAWRRHLVAEGKPVPPVLDIVLEEFRRYRGRRGRRQG